MRKLFLGLVLLVGVLFVIDHFAQLESIWEIAQQGDWRYFGLAIGVEALWLLATAATYFAVYGAIGIKRRLQALIPVAAAANFVNTVAPSAGMSGFAVLITDAKRNRLSSAHATLAQALFVLIEFIGFAFFLVLGQLVLLRRGGLKAPELFASSLLWSLAVLLTLTLYLGMRSEKTLARNLRWLVRRINSVLRVLRRRKRLMESKADEFANKIAEGLIQVRKNPRKLLLAVLASFSSKGLMLIIFGLMFLAFRVPLSPGTLFAGFALAYLFMIVSPTPAGIGVVEGLVTLSLVSMFVPVNAAAVVVLGYRAITFWLPLFVGMVAVQRLSLKPAGGSGDSSS